MRGEIPLNISQRQRTLITPEQAIAMEKIYIEGILRNTPNMRGFLDESQIPLATSIGIRAVRIAVWKHVDPRLVPADRLSLLQEFQSEEIQGCTNISIFKKM